MKDDGLLESVISPEDMAKLRSDMDSRDMYRWEPGDQASVSVPSAMMKHPLSLQAAGRRLEWDQANERWMLYRSRSDKKPNMYRHFVIAFYALLGEE